MSRKDKRDDWDNGMTIAPMNGDELPKYRRAIYLNSERRPKNKREKSDITRKEQRAMIRAMFEVKLFVFTLKGNTLSVERYDADMMETYTGTLTKQA